MKVAIYDGRCSICRKFAGLLRRTVSPRKLDVVVCGSDIQRKIAPTVTSLICRDDFILVDEKGEIHRGADAARKAVTMMPPLAVFENVIESWPGRKLSALIYSVSERFRKKRKCCRKREEII